MLILESSSGYKVITTASKDNFEFLRDRGADIVLDYKLVDVGQQIRRITNGTLRHVFDCVSIASSAKICAEAFGPDGGIYCALLPEKCHAENVKSVFFLSYAISGEDYVFENEFYAAQPEAFESGRRLLGLVEGLWNRDMWKVHPQQVEEEGLGGIATGMQMMKAGKVSGVKLVYRVDDTIWPAS